MFKRQERVCPLLKKECIEASCMFWIHIRGKDPQSSRELDMHDCAIRWLPTLLIENAQVERQTGAAVESMRNEVVRRQDEVIMMSQLPMRNEVELIPYVSE